MVLLVPSSNLNWGLGLGKWISSIISAEPVFKLSTLLFILVYVHACTSVYGEIHASVAVCGWQSKVSDPRGSGGTRIVEAPTVNARS